MEASTAPAGVEGGGLHDLPAVTVAPEASLEQCCRVLEDNKVRRVPVVDAAGVCCGMVSQADIALHAPKGESAQVVRAVSQPPLSVSRIGPHYLPGPLRSAGA